MRDPRPSPLRYPGGKAYLYKLIKYIISKDILNNQLEYLEPYAGGGGLALRLLFNNNVQHIHLNDLDKAIWSFWYSVLNYYNEFINKLHSSDISLAEWKKQRHIYFSLRNSNLTISDILDLGFATFYLNRTNRSGIIHSGGVIGGKSQSGKHKIDARFNINTLENKLSKIYKFRNKISIYNMDGIDFILSYQHINNSFLFIDPPYYTKSNKLYYNNFTANNHIQLNNILNLINSFWVLTYDNHPYIYHLYQDFYVYKYKIPYSAHNSRSGTEFLISNHNLPFLLQNNSPISNLEIAALF